SVLSASDWIKIKTLLREAINDIYDSKAATLTRTVHTIAAKNQLLKHENEQLKEALLNEKKRRQRGKALQLKAPEEYNGGAVFWSPAKVQKARDFQAQKEAEEKAIQAQKDEETKLREQQKLQKAALLEERRRERAAAKAERAREREQKAIEAQEVCQARAIEKQLREELKASQKGNRKSLKPTRSSTKDIEHVQPEILPVEDGVPNLGPSTRTRKICLPQRFQ
ncbi:uncharacterized protein EI97DRAFT_200845, partial [Westerdykella ornata]